MLCYTGKDTLYGNSQAEDPAHIQ